MENLSTRLVDKSIEAFIMGLEIYNKPTIKYRIEGFSFFICNAWELMLKAEMLNRNQSIYFKDNPDRTLSLEGVIKKIYSDNSTRIRLNLERIIELRNISTHYITEDYELKYAPLFQACVLNYVNELQRFHSRDVTNAIDVLVTEYNSDKFAIGIKQNLYITKKKSEADFIVSIANQSPSQVAILKDLKDPSETHKYSYANIISVVNDRLNKKNIKLNYKSGFNQYVLTLVIDFYSIKSDEKYSYCHKIGKSEHYTYSQKFVDFIISEIEKDPQHFVESLKKSK